jgi:hypothetical protein
VKILLEHCVDWRLARSLHGHEVKSAGELGWERLRNGDLLSAAASQFDVVLTVDRNLPHQQNLTKLPVAVVVMAGSTNKLADLKLLIPAVEQAFKTLQPRTLIEVQQ